MFQLQNARFPKDFIFGVADADLQVIGERNTLAEEQSEPTMWTHFAGIPGKTFQGQSPMDSIDRYHRWKEDMQIMKDLGVRAYRTSISISRTMTRDGKPNMKAIEWYRTYFTALRNEGFTIYATLYHWDLPQYLAEMGGWKSRDIIDAFLKHVAIVYEYLGEFIEEYFILNEPFQFTLLSYHLGEHAPGEKDLAGGLLSVHNALLAQGQALRFLKGKDASLKVSTTYNPRVFYAASESEEDLRAMRLAEQYQTRIFTDPLYLGKYPEEFASVFKEFMPTIESGDMETIRVGAELTTFGANFYRGMIIRSAPEKDVQFAEVLAPQGITNGLGWPVFVGPTYPEACYDLLRTLYHRYESYGMKRLYITENGTCWDDHVSPDGRVHDDFRIFFLREHLKQMQKAILAGVPLHGYFVWSLMDNYEWELGFKPGSNFGIVHVDRETQVRTPKDSYYWYRDMVASRTVQ